MSMAVKDRITAVVIFVLSVAGFYTARNYPMGSGTFPEAIFLAGMILSVALFLTSVTGFSQKGEKEDINFLRIFSVMLSSIIYFFLIQPVGYFIVTPIFLFLVSYILNYRKKVTLIAYPIGFTLFLFLVFRLFLNVPLQMGLLNI